MFKKIFKGKAFKGGGCTPAFYLSVMAFHIGFGERWNFIDTELFWRLRRNYARHVGGMP